MGKKGGEDSLTDIVIDALAGIDQGISVFDKNMCLLLWNRRVLELLDLPDDLLYRGYPLINLLRFNASRGEYGEGDVETLVANRMQAILQMEPHRYQRRRSNGVVIEISGRPLPSGGLVSTFTDVSERSLREEELERRVAERTARIEENEKRFRDFAEAASEWFWEMDAALRFTFISKRYFDLSGVEPKDVIGRTRLEFARQRLMGDEAEKWAAHISDLESHRPFREFDYAIAKTDGGKLHIRISGVPVFDRDLNFAGYRGSGTDVTREKTLAEEILRQAKTDPLTGVANRRAFYEVASLESERAARYSRPMVAMMIDLDHFKRINDNYGHDGGDLALKQFAEICKSLIRKNDLMGRIGGEEFALLLPETDLDGALEAARKLRQQISQAVVKHGNLRFFFTISIGIAELKSDLDDMMKRADQALYEAKAQGRNCECLASS
ncbi:MAG: diguanylate cyclase [Alphaproteobacteria bacterium]|nr:diguanylate cyclase [Alphaproteobacteria bacterium]